MSLSPEAQLAGFLGKYTEDVQGQFRIVLAKLRALFPQGFELVYDNYNALAVGWSPTDRASQVVISIAAYPRWVTLFFLKGAGLQDPSQRLQGTGSTVRSVKLAPLEVFDEAEVQALLLQAIAPYQAEFANAPDLATVIKSVSAKQRPRRPATRAKAK